MEQRVLPKPTETLPVYSPCPIATLANGGLPPGGGYGSATEYEIGAQKIGEALHCILGSLHRAHPDFPEALRFEIRHIREEVSVIRAAFTEYAREVYTENLRKNPKSALKTVQSVDRASPALRSAAERSAMRLSAGLPDPVSHVARICYHAAGVLAETVQDSLRHYPVVVNAFAERGLARPILEMERSVVVLALYAGDRLPRRAT